jgi:Na+:H+ antiporter, NhaA family
MTEPTHPPRRRPRADRLVRPLQEFLETSTAGAVALLAAAVVALVWANSAWSAGYERAWATPFTLGVGRWSVRHDLRFFIDDGGMALFFLVVGLEIKRELVIGELRDRRAAALPAIAALGGMLVPALIYAGLTLHSAGTRGWGIPMATDIAFALGVLTLAARHAPASLRPFLLTMAIVDDIGSVVVIAIFYSNGVSWVWLGAGVGVVGVIALLRRLEAGGPVVFAVLAAGLWLFAYRAGIHPAITGVVIGLLTPVEGFPHARRHDERGRPLTRLEHLLLPWTTFVIVPLFAVANAGVRLEGSVGRIAVAVVVARVVGKIAGIAGATWLAVRAGVGRIPSGARWSHVVGVGALGGMGFTVALLVTSLSFAGGVLVASAKTGIIVSAVLAGALGWALLRLAPRVTAGDADADP